MKNELAEKLDTLFPKGESLERGQALVLYAEAVMMMRKEIAQAVKRERGKFLETLKLWRPYFYRDKITNEDIKELQVRYRFTLEEALALYNELKDAQKVAKKLGCSEITVRRGLKNIIKTSLAEYAKQQGWQYKSWRFRNQMYE